MGRLEGTIVEHFSDRTKRCLRDVVDGYCEMQNYDIFWKFSMVHIQAVASFGS